MAVTKKVVGGTNATPQKSQMGQKRVFGQKSVNTS